jgi:hypothetical protein
MGVRHFVPGDDHSHSGTGESLLLGDGDYSRHLKKVGDEISITINPMINLSDWNYEDMTEIHGVDRHEPHAILIAPDECAGNFTLNDAGKYRRHA